MVIPAGTKDPCHSDDRWAGTFSPDWYYEPGLKGSLVPAAKNTEANAKLGHRSKVCSLVVPQLAVGKINREPRTEPKEPEPKPKEPEPKNSVPYSVPDIEEPK